MNRNSAAVLLFLFSIPLSVQFNTAVAASFQSGVDSYNQGDFISAYEEFFELAQRGHVDAQNNLGVLYQTGRGIAQDYLAAARWYRRAARRGHADAQNNLAALYVNGYGVPQDYMMAYAWFNLAASQGVIEAQQHRDVIATRLSPEQIHQAQQIALITPAVETNSVSAAPNRYGPVAAGETLWSIASQVKPRGVSVQAMMAALIRDNPQAFSSADGSGLKVGSRLKIRAIGQNKAQ